LNGKDGKYSRQDEDPRFTDTVGVVESIVTSSAQNDSGLFEPNLRDDRYLPFEGAGVESEWRIELPKDFRQFDYDTISDVIIHLRYTARDGGSALKEKAREELRKQLKTQEGEGPLYRMFSTRQEFSSEWHRFLHPQQDRPHELVLDLRQSRFPYYAVGKNLSVRSIKLFLKLKDGVSYADSDPLKYDLLVVDEEGQETSEVTEAPNKVFKTFIEGLVGATPFTNKSKGPGQRLMRITSPIPKELRIAGNNDKRLDPKAIEDLLVVCEYAFF
jgi:hypothetical protein